MSQKYKITVFKDRFKTVGTVHEKTFEEIYLTFKNKVKRTAEKYNEYIRADKATQVSIKDVGGFVGGETEGCKRVNGIKITRKLLTLDVDTKYPNVFDYLERNIDFYCIVHSTHKHNASENRFRIIAPLSREVNEDEYEALGRRVAYKIENSKKEVFHGLFDETTFQANRLMFFPSVSSDGEYICEILNLEMNEEDQKIINVDEILSEYLDKNDIFEWFKPEKINEEQIGKSTIQNKNPLKAKGMVGAFNRTFSITQAIERFLPHVYKRENNGRYTFIGGGSHGGGIVLNDDTLFYSHHGTDPANLYYRSAFDLVRIHLFGKFDTGFTPERIIEKEISEKMESFSKMVEYCHTLSEVVSNSDNNIMIARNQENQREYIEKNFGNDLEISVDGEVIIKEETETEPVIKAEIVDAEQIDTAIETTQETPEEKPKEPAVSKNAWIARLDGLKSNSSKLDVIFSNDDMIGNLFYYDTFRENICFNRKPYWKKDFVDGMPLQDKDMAHIRVYLDKVYGIRGEKTIDDAVIVEADKIQKNKVLDFFESLVWDGKERIETFFNEFFNVPLNPFTKVAFKHWLVGAVSRIYRAGAPMDLLLVIKGKQGIGKSLFFKKLATLDFEKPSDHLYSDTKIDFDKAKDSYEQLEGIWIYEWKEMAGMNMSEQESIKAFVDKTEDKFRRSYGRRNVEIKRRVAFGGTTNEKTPLRDRTGNRRFIVMESPLARNECYIKNKMLFSQEYRDQLLAEAIHYYKAGFDIFEWTDEEHEWWERSNDENLVENDLLGNISSYLEMKRPKTWYSMSEDEMRQFINGYDFQDNVQRDSAFSHISFIHPPDKVCIHELWKIALKQRDVTINRFHRELIISALETLGWEVGKQQQRFGIFGHQLPVVKKQPEPAKKITGGDEDDGLPF